MGSQCNLQTKEPARALSLCAKVPPVEPPVWVWRLRAPPHCYIRNVSLIGAYLVNVRFFRVRPLYAPIYTSLWPCALVG